LHGLKLTWFCPSDKTDLIFQFGCGRKSHFSTEFSSRVGALKFVSRQGALTVSPKKLFTANSWQHG